MFSFVKTHEGYLKCIAENHSRKPDKDQTPPDIFQKKTKERVTIKFTLLCAFTWKRWWSQHFIQGWVRRVSFFYLLCSLRSLPLFACLLDKARELLLEPAQLTESQSPKLLFFPNRTYKPHQSKLRRLSASHQKWLLRMTHDAHLLLHEADVASKRKLDPKMPYSSQLHLISL